MSAIDHTSFLSKFLICESFKDLRINVTRRPCSHGLAFIGAFIGTSNFWGTRTLGVHLGNETFEGEHKFAHPRVQTKVCHSRKALRPWPLASSPSSPLPTSRSSAMLVEGLLAWSCGPGRRVEGAGRLSTPKQVTAFVPLFCQECI